MVDSASALLDVQPARAFAGSIGSAPGNRVATGPQGHQENQARQRAARLPRPPQDALQGGDQGAQGHQPVHRRAGHLQGQARHPSAALHRRQGAQGRGQQVFQEEDEVRRRTRQTRPHSQAATVGAMCTQSTPRPAVSYAGRKTLPDLHRNRHGRETARISGSTQLVANTSNLGFLADHVCIAPNGRPWRAVNGSATSDRKRTLAQLRADWCAVFRLALRLPFRRRCGWHESAVQRW